MAEAPQPSKIEATFVVVGGGIAAVSCVEELSLNCPSSSILLICASDVVKSVSNVRSVGRAAESFDVEETSAKGIFATKQNVQLLCAFVTGLDSKNKTLTTSDGTVIYYRFLCIATGGKPKLVSDSPFVIGIRDTESVADFQKRLHNAKRIIVLGNGGIATELVYEVQNVQVIWAIKHQSISASFVDAGAAQFFLPNLHKTGKECRPISKRMRYTANQSAARVRGSALGPDWAYGVDATGAGEKRLIHVVYGSELTRIISNQEFIDEKLSESALPIEYESKDFWQVYVQLTTGDIFGCDLVVSATGVEPYTEPWTKGGNNFDLAKDGGLLVNEKLETSIDDIFAAGDVCTAGWDLAPHWIQMRLWTQARQTGCYLGRSMAAKLNGEDISLDICFEIFTHVTEFFGFKVILLGKFNGQGLRDDHEALLRVTKGVEYVKVLIQDGSVHGAILIGETDLEETIENLILNQTDIEHIKDGLLDPDVDIEDYFD